MHEHTIHPLDECPPPGGFCRTHELNIQLLAALYAVSRVLSRSLDFNETLRDVLRVLHDEAGLNRGLISVLDPDSGKLNIHTIYSPEGPILDDSQYGPGEGIIGLVLEKPRTIKLTRVADEARFLNRGDVYQGELPFIAAGATRYDLLPGDYDYKRVWADDRRLVSDIECFHPHRPGAFLFRTLRTLKRRLARPAPIPETITEPAE